jgi:hypothetical protein
VAAPPAHILSDRGPSPYPCLHYPCSRQYTRSQDQPLLKRLDHQALAREEPFSLACLDLSASSAAATSPSAAPFTLFFYADSYADPYVRLAWMNRVGYALKHGYRVCRAGGSPDPSRRLEWSRLPLLAAASDPSSWTFMQDADALILDLAMPLDKVVEAAVKSQERTVRVDEAAAPVLSSSTPRPRRLFSESTPGGSFTHGEGRRWWSSLLAEGAGAAVEEGGRVSTLRSGEGRRGLREQAAAAAAAAGGAGPLRSPDLILSTDFLTPENEVREGR